MSKKGITGHDEWVVTQALATALVALEQLPEKIQPLPHMEDLRKLLTCRLRARQRRPASGAGEVPAVSRSGFGRDLPRVWPRG